MRVVSILLRNDFIVKANLLYNVTDIVRSLHNVSIQFIPPAVERGRDVMIYCNYNLDGAPMLSVKWYRGSHEFYRYSPGMIPRTQTFPFYGLNVDVSTRYLLI